LASTIGSGADDTGAFYDNRALLPMGNAADESDPTGFAQIIETASRVLYG
jgi:hypothetical protein